MMGDFKGYQAMGSWYVLGGEPTPNVQAAGIKRFNGAKWALYPFDRNGMPLEYYDHHWRNCTSGYFRTDGSYNKNNSINESFQIISGGHIKEYY
jgi:hypothetical protein